jgi:hypothetical protein
MGLFNKESQSGAIPTPDASQYQSDSETSVIKDGELAYVRVVGGNGASGYQEAAGAPVETKSPLGYHVNWVAVIFLNVNMMIGTGIFSARTFLAV